MGKTIVWFRKDLRLHDHPALVEAAAHGEVVPVFILPESRQEASDWWLHHSLLELQKKFAERQIQLIVRKGSPVGQLLAVQRDSGAEGIVFNELYDPASRRQERDVLSAFLDLEVQVRSHQGTLLVPPTLILNKTGEPYKVFTSFWKRLRQERVEQSLPVPNMLASSTLLASLPDSKWDLLPGPSWHEKFIYYWRPGEAAAIECWKTFSGQGLSSYKEGRDIPAKPHVSRLSPIWLPAISVSARYGMRLFIRQNLSEMIRRKHFYGSWHGEISLTTSCFTFRRCLNGPYVLNLNAFLGMRRLNTWPPGKRDGPAIL